MKTFALALAAALALPGCKSMTQRQDDRHEPNDTRETAVILSAGQAVEGRANQGNPDFFTVDVPAGRKVKFTIENRGLEDCAAFTVIGPNEAMLYKDANGLCGRSSATPPQTSPGVELVGGGAQG